MIISWFLLSPSMNGVVVYSRLNVRTDIALSAQINVFIQIKDKIMLQLTTPYKRSLSVSKQQ